MSPNAINRLLSLVIILFLSETSVIDVFEFSITIIIDLYLFGKQVCIYLASSIPIHSSLISNFISFNLYDVETKF